jgi:hypothetical protein
LDIQPKRKFNGENIPISPVKSECYQHPRSLARKELARRALDTDTMAIVDTNKLGTLPSEPMLGNVYGIRQKKK